MDNQTWATVLSPGSTPRQASTKTLQRLGMLGGKIVNHLPQIERHANLISDDLQGDLQQVLEGKLPWPIFLTGPAGAGKTCAALTVCDYANGWYKTVRQFLTDMIDCQQDRMFTDLGYKITSVGYWRRIKEANVAVLDEIGTSERVSPHHYDNLCEFLEVRYNQPAIYISNLSLEKIESAYDDRIASRLAAGTVIEVDGVDRRIQG